MVIDCPKSVRTLTFFVAVLWLYFFPALNFGQGQEEALLQTPETEAKVVIANLKEQVKEEDKLYVKYLTTYAIPPELREDAVLTTSFLLHAIAGLPATDIDDNFASGFKPLAIKTKNLGIFTPKQLVPGSKTLWWFDLRDYGLTPQAWEKAALLDGYFAEPILKPDTSGALRLLGGNSLLRMDWFIVNAIDSTRQSDRDTEVRSLYDEFVFCNVGLPKDRQDWWSKFGFNRELARRRGNVSYALVSKGVTVARHNRILEEYRTEYGYGYETYDVKNLEGLRDYVETFFKQKDIGGPPDISDAGEMFTSNQLGLDVYGLRDINNKLINFGDPTVVRHVNDMLGDIRVRNPFSCFDCHAAGPIPPENTLREYVEAEGKLYLKDKRDSNKVQRTYLSNRFEDNTQANQAFFAAKLIRTNGLTPEENAKCFNRIVTWYNSGVNLQRAAYECGVSEDEFKTAAVKNNFGGRLKLLCTTGETIPIESWDSRGKDGVPGQFQQAMIKIYGLTKITETVTVRDEYHYEVLVDTNIQVERTILGQIKAGQKIVYYDEPPKIENGWMKYQNGWIPVKSVRSISK